MTILYSAVEKSLHTTVISRSKLFGSKTTNRPLMRSFIIPARGKTYVKTISDGGYTIVLPWAQGRSSMLILCLRTVCWLKAWMCPSYLAQCKLLTISRWSSLDLTDTTTTSSLKSSNHFRTWWSEVASQIIDSDPSVIGSNNLITFAFQKKTRKLYPECWYSLSRNFQATRK